MYKYKPNTVIVIAYDSKQKHKAYMIDVTSKDFYYHLDDPFSAKWILGYLGGLVQIVMLFVIGFPNQPNAQFYLEEPSRNFKILMIAIGIIMGILIFFVLKRKNQELDIKAYLIKYPDSEKVTKKEEVDMIMNRSQKGSLSMMIMTPASLIVSIFIYRQFWNYHNFGSYLWATVLFMVASLIASFWKNVWFISKFHEEMYADDDEGH